MNLRIVSIDMRSFAILSTLYGLLLLAGCSAPPVITERPQDDFFPETVITSREDTVRIRSVEEILAE